ncbi:hypothetical protein NL108_018634 [Boleophthalmus pectinirostris]|nr:hypothetical protein NL108_018634 [Boleophthalmus pectinirostris]
MSSKGTTLQYSTWNVNGMGKPSKREKILRHLKNKKQDVVFLQETHMSSLESLKLRRDWVGHVFFSAGSTKSRGVAILVNKRTQFKVKQEIKDDDGRIILILAEICGQTLILGSVYAPNGDNPNFFADLENKIQHLGRFPIILGGDFNTVLDEILDCTRPTRSRVTDSSLIIKRICSSLALVDVWRLRYPNERDYTFYSGAHQVFSRIDFFLVSTQLVSSTMDSCIDGIVITDHALVRLSLMPYHKIIRTSNWRLNSSLLKDLIFKEELRTHIKFYLETNVSTAPSAMVAWEAMKAFLRGIIIQHASYKKKTNLAKLQELEKRIYNAEKNLKRNISNKTLNELTQLKYEYNIILSKKTEYFLFKSKQRIFESGDKAGKLLARYIQQKESKSLIAIRDVEGTLVNKAHDINNVFKNYYITLYTSECAATDMEIDSFISNLNLPKISTEQKHKLDSPITTEEILETIEALPSGKSPGPDGFTFEFYKCYAKDLMPLYHKMLMEAYATGSLPPSLNQGIITLLLKKDKDPTDCKNYRPISLISADCQIISKILAKRLDKILGSVVHPDQVGFVKQRNASDNIRRLLDIMWQVKDSDDPTAVISLDAEKAFDRLEWRYMFHTLRAFGFGETFLKWIKLLYSDPSAAVQTNGLISPFFRLNRGTRQGSALSPALFCLALEPLATAIRNNPNIRGIKVDKYTHKIMLFADDILWITSDPHISVPALLETIECFSKLSGYKVNWSKSEALPLTSYCPKNLFQAGSFQWPTEGIKYLGILIPQNINKIIEKNIEPVLKKISLDTQRWSSLTLSLWGKVNVLKMNCVPKLNYLLQCLPITIPQKYFDKFDRICKQFFWNGKRPRIKLTKMQMPVKKGGLGLPKLILYHYAFCLRHIAQWALPPERAPPWMGIESKLFSPLSPIDALAIKKTPQIKSHPIIANLLNVWKKISHIFNLNVHLNTESCIWNNPKLLIDKQCFVWKDWLTRGIVKLADLYEGDTLKSFEKLTLEYNLPKNYLWKYLQLQSLLNTVIGNHSPPQQSTLLSQIIKKMGLGHEASFYYSHIFQHKHPMLYTLKTIWSSDLNINLTDEDWNKICENTNKLSRDVKIKLINFKILNRFYWTPSRLFRLKLKDSENCWKCQAKGTLKHLLWECPLIQNYWRKIHGCIKNITQNTFEFTPQLYILSDPKMTTRCPSSEFIQTSIMIGKQIIMRHWKDPEEPVFHEWFTELAKVASYEQMSFNMSDRIIAYKNKWKAYLNYVNCDNGGEN